MIKKEFVELGYVARGFEEQYQDQMNESPTCSLKVLKLTLLIFNLYDWKC